jgi:hypothetical protein
LGNTYKRAWKIPREDSAREQRGVEEVEERKRVKVLKYHLFTETTPDQQSTQINRNAEDSHGKNNRPAGTCKRKEL